MKQTSQKRNNKNQETRILDAFDMIGSVRGATAQEIAHNTGIRLNSISTLLSKMAKAGKIKETSYARKKDKNSRFIGYETKYYFDWSTIYTLPHHFDKAEKMLTTTVFTAKCKDHKYIGQEKKDEAVYVEQDMWFVSLYRDGEWFVSPTTYQTRKMADMLSRLVECDDYKVFKQTIKVKIND